MIKQKTILFISKGKGAASTRYRGLNYFPYLKNENWYPEHIKRGRFGDWLQNNVDWAFSRERYWGTPLPIWRCEECGELDCIGSFEELENKPGVSGVGNDPDFHRPYMDNITFTCKCGKAMRRVPEVIDCWFDSGAMPFAQMHYPFENQDMFSNGRFPAQSDLFSRIKKMKKKQELRLHGLILGDWKSDVIEQLCEPLHRFNDWHELIEDQQDHAI